MVVNQSKRLDTTPLKREALQENNVKYIIKQSQHYMLGLCDNLKGFKPFDNSVNPDNCIDILVAHRIKSKFHVDDPSVSKDLQSAAFTKYLDYDLTLKEELSIKRGSRLLKARKLLHEWFSGYKLDMANTGYEVSPGETFISSGGEVSLLSKLLDKSHWTVTANCLDDACVFIYNCSAFKRAARHHIGRVTRRERRSLYVRFQKAEDVGFSIFKHLLISRVLILIDGARASSVPKSNDQRRFINIEAMFSVIVQRAIAFDFLKVLAYYGNDLSNFLITHGTKKSLGVIERSAQYVHGLMIKNNSYSTIDFSNASDSVTIAAIVRLFPIEVSSVLLRARSHFVSIDGNLHAPRKLSSMGNGFTFEVMTALLYAIAKTFTSDTRVYGDDVIIPNEFANDFVDTCGLIDFRVNEKKTFINSFFRESCGYFYSDHISDYITSFDFGQIKSLSDVIITCNKLSVIISSAQVSEHLSDILTHARDSISVLVHASRKGPLPSSDYNRRRFLSSYIYDDGYEKKQRRSKVLRTLRQHYVERTGKRLDQLQIERSDVALIFVPFFVPSPTQFKPEGTKDIDVLLPALYSGMRINATRKGHGKWIDIPALIEKDGTYTLVPNFTKVQKALSVLLNEKLSEFEKK